MIKQITVLTFSACALCACGGTYLTKADKSLQKQDALTMCTQLTAANRTDLENIRTNYGLKAANAAQPLFKELDERTGAICRSRIARQTQNEQIAALRAEYAVQIKQAVQDARK